MGFLQQLGTEPSCATAGIQFIEAPDTSPVRPAASEGGVLSLLATPIGPSADESLVDDWHERFASGCNRRPRLPGRLRWGMGRRLHLHRGNEYGRQADVPGDVCFRRHDGLPGSVRPCVPAGQRCGSVLSPRQPTLLGRPVGDIACRSRHWYRFSHRVCRTLRPLLFMASDAIAAFSPSVARCTTACYGLPALGPHGTCSPSPSRAFPRCGSRSCHLHGGTIPVVSNCSLTLCPAATGESGLPNPAPQRTHFARRRTRR